jgi:hypothetical protein
MERPSIRVAVLIEREKAPNQWEDWRFRVAEVMPDEGGFGNEPRDLRDDGKLACTLHPGFDVTLHVDEAEGYHLNLSTGSPVWFVMWRVAEGQAWAARPELVTLSYNEAARLLDAQEQVDNVPLPPQVREWLAAFAQEHYKPEPKQRRRPASFQRPQDRR